MKRTNAENILECLNIYKTTSKIEVLTPAGVMKQILRGEKTDTGDIVFHLDDGASYPYRQLGYYDPTQDGAVVALRISMVSGHQPIATLAFAFGGSYSFDWDRCDIRKMFEKGITAYTIFYDNRARIPFTQWATNNEDVENIIG